MKHHSLTHFILLTFSHIIQFKVNNKINLNCENSSHSFKVSGHLYAHNSHAEQFSVNQYYLLCVVSFSGFP